MSSKTAFYEFVDRIRRWRRERAVRKFARVTGLSLTDSQHRLIAETFAGAPGLKIKRKEKVSDGR